MHDKFQMLKNVAQFPFSMCMLDFKFLIVGKSDKKHIYNLLYYIIDQD